MHVLLPVAGLSFGLPVLICAGALVGFLAGMFGVGGGFLMTPLLMFLGIPPTVAAASDSCQIIAAASSGTAVHLQLGNVDLKLGALVLTGGITGGWAGVRAIRSLRLMGVAGPVITLTYVLALGSVGGYMFWESWRTLRRGALEPGARPVAFGKRILNRLPWQANFPFSQVRHSVLIPLLLGGLVGFLAAIMGVGGGFMMVPMLIFLLEVPTHVAVGTNLFQELFIVAAVTYVQATSNFTVDILLALILAAGSTVGAQVGARVGRLLRGEQLRILLACFVLAMMLKMAYGLLSAPAILLTAARGH